MIGPALGILILVLSPLVQNEDLAALARKEKERRAKIANPTKVLNEKDGKDASAKGTGSVTTLPGPATPAQPTTTSSQGAQASWKQRADQARGAITAAEKELARLETELAKLRADMAPLSAAEAQDPMRLQKREAKINETNKAIAAQKVTVDTARKALSALEDQARKEGVPAGWLR